MKIYKIAQMTMRDVYKGIDEDMKVEDEDEDENGKETNRHKKRKPVEEGGYAGSDADDFFQEDGRYYENLDKGDGAGRERGKYTDWNINQHLRDQELENRQMQKGDLRWKDKSKFTGLTREQFDEMQERIWRDKEDERLGLSPIKWRVRIGDEDEESNKSNKPQKPRYNPPTNIPNPSPTSSMGMIEQRMREEQESRRKQNEEASARKLAEWRASLQVS